ncbi:uncharacterized protein BCR38DRAFT_434175 [Pseudomassariella vexata]|uniref:Uncharacterized protein n=1 Tax=Pseudomassariella vexata TaxID=1141098 RepID=A0A1Y2DXX4_9PEZI|nr:uncharacterized protein BCR38DRAFT_434175 [Pseudomassariella vexata]ORY64152.1 hypothetical protein BCR38DRAFT_434175 [Pseudomassariella vexata]
MPSSIETDTMARQLLSFFTRALKSFQQSNATFRVLCSISSEPRQNEHVSLPPRQAPQFLLILDSSFNPPTLAHQRMALSALSEDKYAHTSRVLLLLAINNADKAPKPAAFPQRLAMMHIFASDLLKCSRKTMSATETETCVVDIAITTEPYFHSKSNAISGCDFYKGTDGTSAEAAPSSQGMEQVYLVGFDTLIRIFSPKYYPDDSMKQALDPFFSHSQLRVTMRPDADWGDAKEQVAQLENLRAGKLEESGGRKEWADQVEMVEGRQEGDVVVSSTKVRGAVQKEDWESLKKLVSEDLSEWVRRAGLYKEETT